jgi:hypothetical protein
VLSIKKAVSLDEPLQTKRYPSKTDELKLKSGTNKWNVLWVLKVDGTTEKLFC